MNSFCCSKWKKEGQNTPKVVFVPLWYPLSKNFAPQKWCIQHPAVCKENIRRRRGDIVYDEMHEPEYDYENMKSWKASLKNVFVLRQAWLYICLLDRA